MSMPSSRLDVATRAAQPAVLQHLLDLQPLLARERAVVRAHQLLAGELVEPLREALGQPAPVDEHDRDAVRPDQLQDLGMDLRPDRAARVGAVAGPPGCCVGRQDLADGGHVLDRHDDLDIERLAHAGVDDLDWARSARLGLRPDAPVRPESRRPTTAAAVSPTGRCAAAVVRLSPRAAPATGPGARRAWCRPARGSRRR